MKGTFYLYIIVIYYREKIKKYYNYFGLMRKIKQKKPNLGIDFMFHQARYLVYLVNEVHIKYLFFILNNIIYRTSPALNAVFVMNLR